MGNGKPEVTRPRTVRQRANDAAMFRMGIVNALEKEADNLEWRAWELRRIAKDLSADVALPAFHKEPSA